MKGEFIMSENFKVQGYKREPDDPKHWDFEDFKPQLKMGAGATVDMRPYSPSELRQNQRQTNSCVAHSVVKALEIKRIMEMGLAAHVDLSILAVYYLAREMMAPPQCHIDDGTFVSHACDILRRFGAAEEKDWPFDMKKVNVSPSWTVMRNAYLHKIKAFYRIRSEGQKRIRDVIAALRAGNPVVYGTMIDNQWFDYGPGKVLQLAKTEEGGHATTLIGWDGENFIGENSWGTHWGDDGFYLMSPDVIASDQAWDFWVIQAPWQ